MNETRAEKAQRLVDRGHVGPLERGLHAIGAPIQGAAGRYYAVIFHNGHFHCTCEWGRTHSYTNDLCAHALAVKLTVERDIPKDTDLPKEDT